MTVAALNSQMQEKMTIRLTELRGQVMTKMKDAGERIKSRPQLEGDKTFSQIKDHSVMKANEDGAIIVGFAMGIPGLDGAIGQAIDVGMELYGDRKAVHMRPQDDEEYSPKVQARIREQNREDLALFMNLDNKLNDVNAAISCGSEWALLDSETGELHFINGATDHYNMTTPKPKPQTSLDEHAIIPPAFMCKSPRMPSTGMRFS